MISKEDKINILHLRDSPWVCGPGRTILETASSIDKTRYNYFVGAFAGRNGDKSSLIDAAVKRNLNVFPIKETRSLDLNIFRQVLKFIDENNIHILHTHEVRSDLIGLVCAKIKRIPVITTLHGWIPNGFKGKFYVCLDKAVLHFFDRIIVVSNRMKNQVLKLGIPEKKISVLYNSIIIDQYNPDRSDNFFKQELGLDMNTVLVGNIGRLSPEKGQKKFIMAAKEVSEKYNNIKFVLLGKGPDQQELEELVEGLQMSDSIIFAGYRTDMHRIYNSLDLIIQSSYTEGMPNVLLESLLMEIPVIATDVGGTSDIIKDYDGGVLIPSGDHKIIAMKIMEYLKSPSQYLQMARDGKTHIQEYFNFRDRTAKLMNIYAKMCCS